MAQQGQKKLGGRPRICCASRRFASGCDAAARAITSHVPAPQGLQQAHPEPARIWLGEPHANDPRRGAPRPSPGDEQGDRFGEIAAQQGIAQLQLVCGPGCPQSRPRRHSIGRWQQIERSFQLAGRKKKKKK